MMLSAVLSGLVLGLSAGFSPGPLMTIVISQTLRHGPGEGVKVATAPLVTDIPIILITVFSLSHLSGQQWILGAVSIAGSLFLVYLAIESFRATPPEVSGNERAPRSLLRGVAVNILSPNPWLFWTTVGAPLVVRQAAESRLAPAVFLSLFYILLVGGKMLIAVITGRSRAFLAGRGFKAVMWVLGALLLVFSGFLMRDGLRFVGVL